ncbi:S9 family peptidase [Microbacterium sp. MYb64]|uniref:alpha/beta hydrolase family protein n=1 Tax=Microbacterium sp. MYb64 TaxID=1848691 RepID=UPI000CFD680A|nr:lipase family protein [Microbacterium sp. MYb64]PRB05007.1 lipase [Microbacterium sp. MYb64]
MSGSGSRGGSGSTAGLRQGPGAGIRHGSTRIVHFDGDHGPESGILHLPHAAPRAGSYPVVAFGHMTTGGSARSAPSLGHPGHPEWRRMSQGDVLCDLLLQRGIAVLRPDYPGIGSAGVHPYLLGGPLGGSLRSMVRARGALDDRLGDDWVAAGHSEGAVAALFAGVEPEPDAASRLRGVAAMTPVTRMDLSVRWARAVPGAFPGSGVVSALIGLMLRGAATADESLRALLDGDGLDPATRERWRDLDRLCLTELAARDSWGGIVPSRIGGRNGSALFDRLYTTFRANDVADLTGFRTPVRIDAARFDEVAPAPLSARMLRRYRRAGVELTARWWPSHHSGTMRARHAPPHAAAWIAARFEE